jgi:error-prone DNA polymerase
MDNRQIIEWDKDDIDALKFMKVDCLALGMLSCMKRCFDMLSAHKGTDLDLARIPPEDPATYAMIRKADTLGVFQIESRAQMAMLPRIKPRTFYDLVIQVAIVRPGPIQGDMVHPYLRRREGKEVIDYPTPELERVLGKTLGVPLFQEQAMRVAIECAGFSPGEADQLRRAMATFKFTGGVGPFRNKLIEGMVQRGYAPTFAERTFRQLEGFGSYGFPESHAASFALIAYASSWMKRHHPEVFCAGLLNAQPMGFYAPAQIVKDARDHGVEIRPVCLNASDWDCTLEETGLDLQAVRLGMRLVRGLSRQAAEQLVIERGEKSFTSLEDLWKRTRLPSESLLRLAEADAFGSSLGLSRREALWAIRARRPSPLPLFEAADEAAQMTRPEVEEPRVFLKPMTAGREVTEDYHSTRLSLRDHPVSFLRDDLDQRGVVTCSEIRERQADAWISCAGLVLIRQRPGSAKGVMFITLEDETGVLNLVVWPKLFEQNRRLILSASMLQADGRLQKEGDVIHLVARRFRDWSDDLARIAERSYLTPNGRGDEFKGGANKSGKLSSLPAAERHRRSGPTELRPRARDFR